MGRVSVVGISRKAVFLPALALTVAAALVQPRLAARKTVLAAGGTIIGVVTTREPGRPALKVTIDPTVCGATVPDESVTVDASGHVAHAIATVTGAKAAAPAEVTVVNEKCRFVPHVALLKPAGNVKITSKDPVLHTTHAQMTGGGKFLFNVSLPIPNMVLSRPVEKAGVVQVVCNTHNWMRGWLVVTEELSAVSGADGSFRLDNVPAGPQEVRIWHEELKAPPVKVTVKEGETVTVNFVLSK
jgi:plastocyanin